MQRIYKTEQKPGDDLAVLLDRWYDIQPASRSPEDFEAFLAARDEFVRSLPEGQRAAFKEYRLDRAVTDTERAYMQAAELMGEYKNIPIYRGMSPERGRAANKAIGRARERARFTGYPVKYALLKDREADPETIKDALRVLGGKRANPNRRLWMRDHPQVALFFSDLAPGEAQQLVGSGIA